MQASAERDGDHTVIERGSQRLELLYPFRIGAVGAPYVERAAEYQDVTPIERGRRAHREDRAVATKHRRHRRHLRPPYSGTGSRQDGHLREYDGRVFDEDGIRQLRGLRDANQRGAERTEQLLIRGMLHRGPGDVDRVPGKMGEFALGERCADRSGDCNHHWGGALSIRLASSLTSLAATAAVKPERSRRGLNSTKSAPTTWPPHPCTRP